MRMFKGPAGSGYDDWQYPRAIAFAASGIRSSAIVAVTCDREIVTGGHADNSVKLVASDGAKTIETASGHCAPVTCLALSPDCNFLVTGSRDSTVLLWKLHRVSSSHVNNLVEPSTAATKPTSPLGASNSSDSSSETNRGRRIEGPIHVLRGHLSEIITCSVSSDLGITASSSHSSGVLLHSLRRGQLLRKLFFKEADRVCLSSQGIVMLWNKSERRISTFTVNGVPIATKILSPFSGTISCIEISLDGKNALIGTSSSTVHHIKDNKLETAKPCIEDIDSLANEVTGKRLAIPVPSICFLDLHTLEVFHGLVLKDNQDITAVALNKDNTNLLVSTADKQLIVFTDPTLSLKVVDQMLRLGWEGGGLAH
ncbi:BEACH domain-containing protein C2-like [Iris pallida]|nr:BEACH domain-containing protein C2-like [Iris pallida]